MKANQFANLDMFDNNFILEYTPVGWEGYYDRKLTAIFDPVKDTLYFNNAHYPKFMRNGSTYGISGWNYSRIVSEAGSYIYSFNYDPTLYVITEDKEALEIDASIPNQFDKSKEPISEDAKIEEQIAYFLQRTQFFDLYEDKKERLFARVVYNGINDEQLQTSTKWEDKSFYLQIFDRNYRYIGYQYFKGKKFSSSSMFFHNKMVYMPYHNKSNLEASEDKIILYRYEINL